MEHRLHKPNDYEDSFVRTNLGNAHRIGSAFGMYLFQLIRWYQHLRSFSTVFVHANTFYMARRFCAIQTNKAHALRDSTWRHIQHPPLFKSFSLDWSFAPHPLPIRSSADLRRRRRAHPLHRNEPMFSVSKRRQTWRLHVDPAGEFRLWTWKSLSVNSELVATVCYSVAC